MCCDLERRTGLAIGGRVFVRRSVTLEVDLNKSKINIVKFLNTQEDYIPYMQHGVNGLAYTALPM